MTKYIFANFKSNKNIKEFENWAKTFIDFVKKNPIDNEKINISVFPSFTLLQKYILENLKNYLNIGVQNINHFDCGAFTGEICTKNLENLHIKYALLGHSERRKYFKETNKEIAKKTELAKNANITPVICIDMPYAFDQLDLIQQEILKKSIIAYEPIEAISTFEGKTLDNKQLEKNIKSIRNYLKKRNINIPVIYGGSVNKDNANNFLQYSDGLLIGKMSLEIQNFLDIIREVYF